MLREAREQKEKAIQARNSADRERDDAITRYEEKCREMERFEESMSGHLHTLSHAASSAGRRETRVVKRTASSSQANGHGESYGHSHSHGHSHESSGHEHGHSHGTALIEE